jgi:hypothetical protein
MFSPRPHLPTTSSACPPHLTMSSSTTPFPGSDSKVNPPKRRTVLLEEDMANALYEAMEDYGVTAEMAILYLMRDYTSDFETLLECVKGSSRYSYLVTLLYLNLTGIGILTHL